MNRRDFFGIAAAAASVRAGSGGIEIEVIHSRNPYEALLRNIEPGHDDYPLEKEAAEKAGHLKRLLETRAVPLAPDFTGTSPLPARYVTIAEGVAKAEYSPNDHDFTTGLQRWLHSLEHLRALRFYVLADDVVRYEIALLNRYIVGLWKQRWTAGRLTHFSPLEEIVTTAPAALFTDVTSHAFHDVDSFERQLRRGVPYWRARLDAACGIDVHGHNGIAVGDIDNDGWDEVYICQPGGLPNRLYKNRGDGSFDDITERAGVGVLDPTSSALFADFRNTGRQDLVVLRPGGPLLFLNQGDRRFILKPGAFRFRNAPQGSFTGMAAADYDRDGRLDLYLCTYSFFRDQGQYRYPLPYYDARNGPANFLFHNELTPDGGGQFSDCTEAAGLNQNNDRFSFAAAWCDYDGDGWPDLYVANDFGRKNLYKNDNGRFRDIAAEAGVEDMGDGMSAAWFDYDGDGLMDLYVSNMWSDAGQRVVSQKPVEPADAWRRHAKGNSLYRNRGDGTFEDTGAREGVEMGRWAWSSDGIDFDNDGVPEIFVTTGMLTSESDTDLESFFWRNVALAKPEGGADENGWNALSQAVHGEYSEAGRQPNVYYARRSNRYYDFSGVSGLDVAEDSRAFAVTDIDGDGNVDLLLKSRLGPQVRVFRNDATDGRRSIAFRLRGVRSNRDAVGARVEVDGRVKFLQAGSGYLSQHTKTVHFGLDRAERAKTVRILWPLGATQEFHDLAAGACYAIEEGSDAIHATPFLARRAMRTEPVTGDNKPVFTDTALLEPVPLPEQSAKAGWLELPANIPRERADKYALFFRYLFDLHADLKLPVWFLVDDRGRAERIAFSAPSSTPLAPLPFTGKYYTPPKRNYSALGVAFFAAGYSTQALQYLELAPQDNEKILFAIGKIQLGAGRFQKARESIVQGLQLAPDSADGWNTLGGVDASESRFAPALVNFQKALAIDPHLPSALINAGQAELALGHPAAAETMFRRALAINPKDAAAANQMGELSARQKNDEQALQWFQQAIAARRDYAPAIGNLAALYIRHGRKNDAIAAFLYGIGVAPDEESLYLNLASLYLSAGNTDAAKRTVERLLTRIPNSARGKQAMRQLEPM